MTVTIQLPSDIEAALLDQARAHGLDLPRYVEQVLRERLRARTTSGMSPGERAEGWRKSTEDLPHTPPLSDDAISRENMNADRDR
ncbi:MAG TPA: hypothetical protein VFA04_00410 [Bryobacteraceae bacterium]|nr:hypothetical protein [Bryobacteraceae bacterium]